MLYRFSFKTSGMFRASESLDDTSWTRRRKIMSPGEIERLRNEEGLQILFGALLGVEANGVERQSSSRVSVCSAFLRSCSAFSIH